MQGYLPYLLEALMRKVLAITMLVGAVVFVGGTIFGWEYAMFLAFVILLAIVLIDYFTSSGGSNGSPSR